MKGASFAYTEGKTEPAGVGSFGGDGEHQDIFQRLEGLPQIAKIIAPRVDKLLQVVQLRQAQSRLHVRGLKVIANVRVGVFVVVATGERAELPIEALAAGVIDSWLAPAVSAPVAKRFDQGLEQRACR